MTLKEIFNENVKTESVFSFLWHIRSFKYSTTDIEGYRIAAWHCPRVEVSDLVKGQQPSP